MGKTKADCDKEIARLKGRIVTLKASLARAKKEDGHNGVNTQCQQGQYRSEIAYCEKQIYALQAEKKGISKSTKDDKTEDESSFAKRIGRFFKRLVILAIVIIAILIIAHLL